MGGPSKKVAPTKEPKAAPDTASAPKGADGPANSELAAKVAAGAGGGASQATPTLDLLDMVDEGVDLVRNGYYALEHMLNPSFGIEQNAPASQERETEMRKKFRLFGDEEEVETSPEHAQQYTGNGVPLTADAWALQNQVDGGKFQDVHDRAMLGHLVGSGAVDGAALGDLSELPGDRVAELVAAARGEQSPEQFFGAMDSQVADQLQESMLSTYIDQANNSDNASFILEMLPTDTTSLTGSMVPAATRDPETGLPNQFQVGADTGLMRNSSVAIADQLRGDDPARDVYGLVVPYSNTVPNVFDRDGTPTDGSYNLHKTLRHIDQDVNTVATGYSQGGAAVLDYVQRYGDVDGLDAAVAMAPMGGSDRGNPGSDGLYHGMLNDVPTLSATHALDPARSVFEDMSLPTEEERDTDLFQRGLGFSLSENGPLHSGFDPANPMGGTFGYPTQVVSPLLDGLLGGSMGGEPYQRRADWNHDSRE